MSGRGVFAVVALLAVAAGGGLWWATRARNDAALQSPSITPSALWAATFRDAQGTTHALGELQGHVVVVNFWATWCVPCREEMPAFARLQERWKDRGVRFVGLANDDPAKVERFGRDLGINYPLWLGDDSVGELSRRLGNRLGMLPHTVILDPGGSPVDARVGPYPEAELDAKLAAFAPKRR